MCPFFPYLLHCISILFLDLDRDLLLLDSLRNLFLPRSWLLFATSSLPWELSSLAFFILLNPKRTLMISSKSRVYFPHIRVVTRFSYVEETGREFSNINALSSSSNFTSICFKSLMIWLNTLICWLRSELSAILRPYGFYLRYNLFVNDLDIYRLSNFNQIATGDSSSMTWYITSSAKQSLIVAATLASKSFQSMSSIPSGYFSYNAFTIPCCTNRSLTLLCHRLKFPNPSNLTKSNFIEEIPYIDPNMALIPIFVICATIYWRKIRKTRKKNTQI